MNNNNKKVLDFSNDFEDNEKNNAKTNIIQDNNIKTNGLRKNNFINNKKNTSDEIDTNEKNDGLENNDFKRDDSKWKFNKNELLERKKKLLKDKTNIKKVKK